MILFHRNLFLLNPLTPVIEQTRSVLVWGVLPDMHGYLVVLVLSGVVELSTLKEWRSYVIVGAFVVAAIFTPPDVVSQLMLAIPLCLLYELGMLMARFVRKLPARGESSR